MNELNKVLIVAFLEESRQAAYEIIQDLKGAGYSCDICFTSPKKEEDEEEENVKVEPETKLQANLYLTENTDPSIYHGVIFLDDGGDAKTSVSLAKAADEMEKAVGGYAHGCSVLHAAGLFKDHFICIGLPEEMSKGAKIVNSPSVRADNIVTAAGNCPTGFAFLMIDALGGECKRTIESTKPGSEPLPHTALVISPLQRWAEFWELSERLAEKDMRLVVADWNDIDVANKTVKRCLAVGPLIKNQVALIDVPYLLPQNIWFRQVALAADAIASAVESLEKAGCVNINSSEALRLANDKLAMAKLLDPICPQGNVQVFEDADAAAEKLVSHGAKWARSLNAHRSIKIHGQGEQAMVTKKDGNNTVHQIHDRKTLAQLLRNDFKESFVVQDDLGSMRLGDQTFELKALMRRTATGWNPSAVIAQSNGITCAAEQILKLLHPDNWESRLVTAADKAQVACIAFQSGLANADGIHELGVDLTFAGDEANVIGITAMPDLSLIEKAVNGHKAIVVLAQSLGLEIENSETVPAAAINKTRGEIAPMMNSDKEDDERFRVIERELGHHGIWPQPDGRLAINENEQMTTKSVPDAIKMFKSDLRHFIQKFKEADGVNWRTANNVGRLIRMTVLKLRLINELGQINFRQSAAKAMTKTADYAFNFEGEYDYSEGTVSGPYSNVQKPVHGIRWRAGDDFLKDISDLDQDLMRRLSRYHPESKEGFAAEFDLWHRNDPTPWSEIEKGEGYYPSRIQLMR